MIYSCIASNVRNQIAKLLIKRFWTYTDTIYRTDLDEKAIFLDGYHYC